MERIGQDMSKKDEFTSFLKKGFHFFFWRLGSDSLYLIYLVLPTYLCFL